MDIVYIYNSYSGDACSRRSKVNGPPWRLLVLILCVEVSGGVSVNRKGGTQGAVDWTHKRRLSQSNVPVGCFHYRTKSVVAVNFTGCYKLSGWRFCACAINVKSSMCSEAQSSRLTDCRSAAKLRREDSLMSLLAFVCLSTSRTLVNPANLYFYLFRVNISLILKVFIIQHYLIKMYPYLICMLFVSG